MSPDTFPSNVEPDGLASAVPLWTQVRQTHVLTAKQHAHNRLIPFTIVSQTHSFSGLNTVYLDVAEKRGTLSMNMAPKAIV